MKVQIKYFASIREAIGQGAESLDTPAPTLAALRDALIARGKAVRVALNQTLCDESASLVEGAEVAFFPPVTGG